MGWLWREPSHTWSHLAPPPVRKERAPCTVSSDPLEPRVVPEGQTQAPQSGRGEEESKPQAGLRLKACERPTAGLWASEKRGISETERQEEFPVQGERPRELRAKKDRETLWEIGLHGLSLGRGTGHGGPEWGPIQGSLWF